MPEKSKQRTRINFGLKENKQPSASIKIQSESIDLKKAKRMFNPEEKYRLNATDKSSIYSEKNFNQLYETLDPAEKSLYRIWSIEVEEGEDAEKILEDLRNNSNVDFADIDQLNILYARPNDPLYPKLYGMKKIDAECAWKISKGDDIVVAVVDTGVDYNHPDINANMWQDQNGNYGYDFSDGDNDPLDYHGHGSHCAGTVAAVGDNNVGVIGVAPKAKIMAVKIFPNAHDHVIAQALKYAVDNGAKIISNSWGPSVRRPSAPILEAAVNYVYSKGGICVFAAGNNDDDVQYYSPANMTKTIAVAATDANDQRPPWSNFGNKVDLAAPGDGILSLMHNSNGYTQMNGTSMSCPHVAGAAALLVATDANLRFEDVRDCLQDTADKITPDKYIGKGRLNVCALLRKPKPIKVLCPDPQVIKIPIKAYANQSEFTASSWSNHTKALNSQIKNRFFLHTFRWKKPHRCCQVLKAKLHVKMKSLGSGRSLTSSDAGNDRISVVRNGGTVIQPLSTNVYNNHPFASGNQATITFTLSGSQLDWLNSTRKLSFLVQDDTSVLEGYLQLYVCCLKSIKRPNPKE